MKSLWARSSVGAWRSSRTHRTHWPLHHSHLCSSSFVIKSTSHLRGKVPTEAWRSVWPWRSRGPGVSRGPRLTISTTGPWTSLLPLLSSVSSRPLFSWGSHRTGWSPRSHNICYVSWFPLLSLSTWQARGGRLVSGTDWTALPKRDLGFGTVFQLLADDFVAQHRTGVANTDATRLWFPHVLVPIELAVLRAAAWVLVILLLAFDNGQKCD